MDTFILSFFSLASFKPDLDILAKLLDDFSSQSDGIFGAGSLLLNLRDKLKVFLVILRK